MRRWSGVVVALYCVSGVTALAYQVLWARMLALQFGVSIFGIVATVAAFMLGLGAGSLIGARWRLSWQPLFLLALLEAGVALFAIAIPFLFDLSGGLLRAGDLSLKTWYVYEFIAALILLMLPATLLGMGFPLILRALSNSRISLGTIYGVNALGGVVGALIPLALLPSVGWLAANYSIAALGFFLAVSFLVLSRRVECHVHCSDVVKNTGVRQVSHWGSYLAYAGVGAAALMLEIAWTRLFGMILLRTEYVLAVILAMFLLGIGVGSLLAKRLLLLRNTLVILPVFASLFAVLSLWAIPWLADWVESSQYASLTTALLSQGVVIVLLTAPVTLALGMWLPVLSRHLENTMPLAGAKLYGVNSLGAALGACLAGFVMIPLLGTTLTICVAAVLLFTAGMYWVTAPRIRLIGLLLLLLLLAFPVAMLPQVNVLLPHSLGASRDLYFYEDAVSISHVVERQDGQRLLLGDLQRMDASSEPSAVVAQQNQARLPLLLHGNPRSVLFLGVGTGISASGSLPFPGLERVGVELSAGAIHAAKYWFTQVNDDVSSQMRVVRDDVRRFLQRDAKNYDVIIGDLFHPDLVGRSALLSVEQFQRVRARLTPENGLYVQWLALNQFDVASLQVVLRTFRHVFPKGELFLDGFRLALVGYAGQRSATAKLLHYLEGVNEAQKRQAMTGGEGLWTWLGRYYGPLPDLGSGAMQMERSPYIEYRLPKIRFSEDYSLASLLLFLLDYRPSVAIAAVKLGISGDAEFEQFERAYAAVGLVTKSWIAAVQGDNQAAERLVRFAYSANEKDRWVGFDLADRMYASVSQAVAAGYQRDVVLQQILKIRADHEGAIKELWQLAERAGDHEQAVKYRARLKQLSPLAKE
ncbi:MAG: spermine synthase [Gammaproteobacteria bacterium]|nr:spermine synthase [Gammaproteobacteria bacterium]